MFEHGFAISMRGLLVVLVDMSNHWVVFPASHEPAREANPELLSVLALAAVVDFLGSLRISADGTNVLLPVHDAVVVEGVATEYLDKGGGSLFLVLFDVLLRKQTDGTLQRGLFLF